MKDILEILFSTHFVHSPYEILSENFYEKSILSQDKAPVISSAQISNKREFRWNFHGSRVEKKISSIETR